jgi:CheY-like chemotaxis protein
MKRIAVVEDNPDNRLLVRVVLGDSYHVTEFENGFDAVAAIPDQQPDLVLLDISLPGMDGTEVVKKLRTELGLHHLPVIALTAHAMAGDCDKYLAFGFDPYVSKPIKDETILLGEIERCLTRRHPEAK